MRRQTWPDPPSAPDGFSRALVASPTDADLAIYHRHADGAARATVCVLHSIAEHAARYAHFAASLAAAGVHVYAHDTRGHGATRARDAPLGVFARRNGLAQVIADSVFVSEHARATHPDLPVILLGHSIGGVLALNHVLERPDTIDGIAVWNVNLDAERLGGLRRVLSLKSVLGERRVSWMAEAIVFDSPRRDKGAGPDALAWLSRNAEERRRYHDDPLCGWAPSAAMWRDIAAAIARANDDAAFGAVPRGTPFHLLGGSADPVTDGGAAVVALDGRLRNLGFTDVARVIVEGARHATLHDDAREEAVRAFVRWMDGVAAG